MIRVCFSAAPPGFEPGHTDPESAVLPLHHGAKFRLQIYLRLEGKSKIKFWTTKQLIQFILAFD